MKISSAYLEFLSLVNRNLTNNNVNVDKPRFVILFNSISREYLEWVLKKRNDDSIRYVSPLLVLDKSIKVETRTSSHDSYKLPDDYFDLANLQVIASKGSCKKQRLTSSRCQ